MTSASCSYFSAYLSLNLFLFILILILSLVLLCSLFVYFFFFLSIFFLFFTCINAAIIPLLLLYILIVQPGIVLICTKIFSLGDVLNVF